LLAAEITARMGRDLGEICHGLTREFGGPAYDSVEAAATPDQQMLTIVSAALAVPLEPPRIPRQR
jgi:phosphoglucomutase